MEIRTSTVAVVAASCITIGAAGAFLEAARPSAVPQPAPAADVATKGASSRSEGVVSDAPVEPAQAAARQATRGAVRQSRDSRRNLASTTPRPAPAP